MLCQCALLQGTASLITTHIHANMYMKLSTLFIWCLQKVNNPCNAMIKCLGPAFDESHRNRLIGKIKKVYYYHCKIANKKVVKQ